MADENNSIIRVENVSMRFRMANDRVTSIKEMVTKMLKRQVEYKDFWATMSIFLVCSAQTELEKVQF